MEPLTLTTELRTNTGKGPARRLRAQGLIPGVFYGRAAEATGIAVTPKALTQALSTPYRRNTLLQLELAGQKRLAMVKELQIHPVSRKVLHVDLYEVALDRPVRALVPFATEGRAKGVVAGGELYVVFRDLPVRAAPDKIPDVIKVDVTNLELGDAVRVKDLALPPGVEVVLDAERSVTYCAEPRKLAPEEDETKPAAAEGAAAAAAPGAAAPAGTAPAAPTKDK
jgi:large subunit ribosomal protein L25